MQASGNVVTGGWRNPTLVPWMYTRQPADGMLDLDFLANSPWPDEPVTRHLTRIDSPPIAMSVPGWVKGVRVHAAHQSYAEARLEQDLPAAPVPLGEGMPLPWPFPWFVPSEV